MKNEKAVTKTVKPILWSLALLTALSVVPDRAAQAHEESSNVTIIWNSGGYRVNPYPDVPPPKVIAMPSRVIRYSAPPTPVYYPAYYYVWTPRGWVRQDRDFDRPHHVHPRHHVDNRDNFRPY